MERGLLFCRLSSPRCAGAFPICMSLGTCPFRIPTLLRPLSAQTTLHPPSYPLLPRLPSLSSHPMQSGPPDWLIVIWTWSSPNPKQVIHERLHQSYAPSLLQPSHYCMSTSPEPPSQSGSTLGTTVASLCPPPPGHVPQSSHLLDTQAHLRPPIQHA